MENISTKLEDTGIRRVRKIKIKKSPQFSSSKLSSKQKKKLEDQFHKLKTAASLSQKGEASKPHFPLVGLERYRKSSIEEKIKKPERGIDTKIKISLNAGFLDNPGRRTATPDFGVQKIFTGNISDIEHNEELLDSIFSFTTKEQKFIQTVKIEADAL